MFVEQSGNGVSRLALDFGLRERMESEASDTPG
jgi:hypothetical protein